MLLKWPLLNCEVDIIIPLFYRKLKFLEIRYITGGHRRVEFVPKSEWLQNWTIQNESVKELMLLNCGPGEHS